jgi:hypothetical protein
MGKGHTHYGGQDTREKIIINGIPNHLNYCVIFIVYIQLRMWLQATKYNRAGWRPMVYVLCQVQHRDGIYNFVSL